MSTFRLCIPLAEWPPQDQSAWLRAIGPSNPFGSGGEASSWKPKTRRTVLMAYGRWLRFALARGWITTSDTPFQRATKERLIQYLEHLEAELAPVTVAGRIRDIAGALSVMDPEADVAWIYRAARRLASRAKPTRAKPVVHIQNLFELGVKLLEDAVHGDFTRQDHRNARYRLGLTIVVLCTCPIRRANFTELNLGTTMCRTGDRYSISLSENDTKGGRPHDAALPPEVTEVIDHYLEHIRPKLLKGRASNRLWISWQGADLTEAGFYGELCEITNKHFGFSIPPHRFRDCTATSVALDDPMHLGILKNILQHRSLATTSKHYIQADQNSAVGKLQAAVGILREDSKQLGGRSSQCAP